MDDLQQRIAEIAAQLPGYPGYQAKERRRDADKQVRMQLAAKYDEQRTRLMRLQQQATLKEAYAFERLDQKLQRLIARLKTAPRGYAGWFDAAQIVEADLDQLLQFDTTLAGGVEQVQATFDALTSALKAKETLDDALAASAETLDALNDQFDQREQFVALGKKPSLTATRPPISPLDALKKKAAPPQELAALANLKLNDAVAYGGVDYLVTGKITYTIPGGSFWAFLLQDRDQKRWLRVGPATELVICQESSVTLSAPLPDSLPIENHAYARGDSGTANVNVEGAGGGKRGSVTYTRYASENNRLWVEDFGAETRVTIGQVIDPFEVKVYRK